MKAGRTIAVLCTCWASILLLAALLAACGGGGGGGTPQPTAKLTLRGTVTAAATAAEGATVLLGLSLVSTDAGGHFSFANLSAGSYVISAEDAAGNFSSQSFTLSSQNTSVQIALPVTAPFAARSLSPPLSSSAAELDAEIRIDLGAAIDPASLAGSDFTVTPDPGPLALSADGSVLVISPVLQLPPAQTFVFDYSGSISSAGGATLPKPLRFTLRTESTDSAPPRLLETSPVGGSSGHPTNRPVLFTFNENIDPASPLEILVTPDTQVTASIGGRTLSLRASGGWQPNTAYTISIGGIRDLAGNTRPNPAQLAFTSGVEAAPVTNLQPNWNRVTDSIVFASDSDGGFDIWAIDSDGGNLRRLSSLPGDESHPSLSSDGALLAFQARGSGGDADIYVADVSDNDAADAHAVTGGPFADTQPVFSRTFSRTIFFVSERTVPASIHQINSSGGGLIALDATFGSGQSQPAPHPLLDTQILFTSGRSGSSDIWRMNVSVIDGSVVDANETDDLLAEESAASWLPDASGYAYISDRNNGNQLWLADLSGGLPRQVTSFSEDVSGPSVSPFSGDSLCAISLAAPDCGRDIVIIELVGGTIVRNLTGGGAGG